MSTNYIDDNLYLKEFNNLQHICSLSVSDFENQIRKFSPQPENKLLYELKRVEYKFRIDLFSKYYNISQEEIEALIDLPQSERKQACAERGVNRFILRTLFDYNRYPECFLLHNFLSRRLDLENKNLLDFGCLVADYGFYFGMLNMKITFCDIPEHADFADYRLSKANINRVKCYAPADYKEITKDQDVAVFSEVLEHLDDPCLLLESCVDNKVKYVFTTGYPYGDADYFNAPGHTKAAEEQAPQCIELLRENYLEVRFMKRLTVWIHVEELYEG